MNLIQRVAHRLRGRVRVADLPHRVRDPLIYMGFRPSEIVERRFAREAASWWWSQRALEDSSQ